MGGPNVTHHAITVTESKISEETFQARILYTDPESELPKRLVYILTRTGWSKAKLYKWKSLAMLLNYNFALTSFITKN